jgi:hypothetical protein
MPLGRHGCLFIHIPKCAGTSIEVALGVANGYPNIGFEPTSTAAHPSRLFGAGLQHLTLREIRQDYPDVIAMPGLWSFSIIRDPVDRFVSHFVWKRHRFRDVRPDENELNALLEEIELLIGLSRGIDIFRWPFSGVAFRENDTLSFPLDDIRRHYLPQCSFLFDHGATPIDAIYPIEALRSLEADLQRRGAIEGSLPQRMVGIASKALRQMIPANAERAIKNIYRHDMRLHDYVLGVSKVRGFCPGSAIDLSIFGGEEHCEVT